MPEIKIFVDIIADINENKVVICQENATKLGIKNGASIEVLNLDNDKTTTAVVEISNMVLDFAGQVSKDIIDVLEFKGVELLLRPVSSSVLLTPKIQIPKVPSVKPLAPSPPTPSQSTLTPLPTRPAQMQSSKPTPQPLPIQQPEPIQPPMSGHVPLPTKEPEPESLPTQQPEPFQQPVSGHVPLPTKAPEPTPPPQIKPVTIPPPTSIPMSTPPPQQYICTSKENSRR